jgi:hypothetical protein
MKNHAHVVSKLKCPVLEAVGLVLGMGCDRATCQGAAPAHCFDLQMQILEADGVVAIHRTLPLQGEDIVQIASAGR